VSDIASAQPPAAVAPRTRTPHPRLWAVVGLVLGVPLAYVWLHALDGFLGIDQAPAAWPMAGTVAIGVLAIGTVAAVVLQQWRLAVVLATVLALPWIVVALTFVLAYGLSLLLLPPALVWVPSIVSSSRALAAQEAAVGGPSVEQRRRRATLWVASTALVLAVLVVTGMLGLLRDDRQVSVNGGPLFSWAVASYAFLGLMLGGCLVVLALIAARRWRAARTLTAVLGISLLVSVLVILVFGLAAVALLGVPLLIAGVHLDALASAERVARAPVASSPVPSG
jgi:hypothetical protein